MGNEAINSFGPRFSPWMSGGGGANPLDAMLAQLVFARLMQGGMPAAQGDQFSRGGTAGAFQGQQSPWAMNGFSPEMMLGLLVMLAMNMPSSSRRSSAGNMGSNSWGSSQPVSGGWNNTPASIAPAPTGGRTMDPGSGKNVVPAQFGGQFTGIQQESGCGPLAAIGTARALGMNPDIQNTFKLAEQSGWNGDGMNGPANYVRLLQKMGISAQLKSSASSDEIASAVQAGKPVTISTGRHYFLATDYNPQTGEFYVGNSGTAMKAGKDWMTLAEINALGEGVNGVVFPS